MTTKGIIELATLYAEAGFTIIKLKGKKPVAVNWTKANYLFEEEISDFLGNWGDNYGVVIDKNHIVIDVDPRSFKDNDDPHIRLFKEADVDIKQHAFIVQTGGEMPGLHIYFKLPLYFKNKIREKQKEYPGLEFKTKGRQVVGAGSTHPDTQNIYKALNAGQAITNIQVIPESLLNIISKPEVKSKETKPIKDCQDDKKQVVDRYIDILKHCPPAIEGDGGDLTTYQVACKGRDLGLSENKTFELLEKYYNHRCRPPWTIKELKEKVTNAYAYAAGDIGNDLPENDFEKIEGEKPFWVGMKYGAWDQSENGNLKGTQNNVKNFFLRSGSPLMNTVIYDDFNHRFKTIKKFPWWPENAHPKKYGTVLGDGDIEELSTWFSIEQRFNPTLGNIGAAVRSLAKRKRIHPIKDSIRSIKWDQVSRLETWLIDYAKAEDTKLTREVSKVTILQAVNRVFDPGCQADLVLILEGDQGIGKSSIVRILGGDYYADVIIDPRNKDTVVSIQGKWIIEQSEMVFTRKGEAESIKRFLTLVCDDTRLPYAQHAEPLDRQCVFIGTVNKDATGEYLNDPTGNRRFWPVEIGTVDLKGLKKIREQLFAEALDRLWNGEKPYIDKKEILELGRIEQAKRQSTDAYQDIIAGWVMENKLEFITTKDVWEYALKGNPATLNGGHQRRIANCLKNLNYELKSMREDGKVKRGYYNKRFVKKE